MKHQDPTRPHPLPGSSVPCREARDIDALALTARQLGRIAHGELGGEAHLAKKGLGALDPLTRSDLQREFLALQQKLRKTVLFVTHDLREALLLGTRIALLEQGRLVSLSSPAEFLRSSDPLVSKYVEAFGVPNGTQSLQDQLKRGSL